MLILSKENDYSYEKCRVHVSYKHLCDQDLFILINQTQTSFNNVWSILITTKHGSYVHKIIGNYVKLRKENLRIKHIYGKERAITWKEGDVLSGIMGMCDKRGGMN